MAESFFPQDNTIQPVEKPKNKRPPFVARNTAEFVQARSQRLYSRQLDGQTTRQLVLEHARIEGISPTTAWEDWNRVKKWNKFAQLSKYRRIGWNCPDDVWN